MKFFIGDEEYNYSDKKLALQLINYGEEADVYKIKDKAVKIYNKQCYKNRLDEETVEYFKNIKTDRILLPIDTVYDENKKFSGLTTKFIDVGNKQTIRRMKMPKFIKEIQLLINDTKLLTELGITICDFDYEDILYGDGIYYCDSGSFEKNKKMTSRKIEEANKEEIHKLIIDELLCPVCQLNKKQLSKLKELILSGEYISDIFSCEEYKPNESVLSFIKRITK